MKLQIRKRSFFSFFLILVSTLIGTINAQSDEKTNEEIRTKVVDRIREMATIPWTPLEDITYWNKKYGVVFKKGEHYTGIPYTQRNRQTSTKRFRKHLDSNGTYTGPADYIGSDCSSSVSNAWRAIDPELPFLSTHLMFPGMGKIVKVGEYEVTSLNLTSDIVKDNGKEVIFAAYEMLKPGDAVMTRYDTDGHVRLVSKVDPENRCVYVIEQCGVRAGGKTVSDHSTWRVDRKMSYDELFETNYIPITHIGLIDTTTSPSGGTE